MAQMDGVLDHEKKGSTHNNQRFPPSRRAAEGGSLAWREKRLECLNRFFFLFLLVFFSIFLSFFFFCFFFFFFFFFFFVFFFVLFLFCFCFVFAVSFVLLFEGLGGVQGSTAANMQKGTVVDARNVPNLLFQFSLC